MRLRNKFFRLLALFMAIQMVTAAVVPTITYALTSGPSQPEFSSFEPVATTNMVNSFTGDFTYNLPLLEVSGPQGSSYPISLSYHSGVTPAEEASWVGYGWTLNAGAINRAVSGIPDDFKKKSIVTYNKTRTNWTATVGISGALEIFGYKKNGKTPNTDAQDAGDPVKRALDANVSLRYNNYNGFGYNVGAGVNLGKGVVSMGYNVSDGNGSFSLGVNPVALFNAGQKLGWDKMKENNTKADIEGAYKSALKGKSSSDVVGDIAKRRTLGSSFYGLLNYAGSIKSIQLQPYSGASFNFSVGLELNPVSLPIGKIKRLFGSFAYQNTKEKVSSDAYGYLYSGEANIATAQEVEGFLTKSYNNRMDYSTEKGSSFSKKDSVLGIPFNSADQFMVSGEGLGGGFRLYHKKIGHFGPRYVRSAINTFNLGAEVQAGGAWGGGADIGYGRSTTRLTDWNRAPSGSEFSRISDESADEPVFFRFINDLGGSWGADLSDAPIQTDIDLSGYVSSDGDNYSGPVLLKKGTYSLPTSNDFKYEPNNGVRSGRSSYIGFNLNKDVYSTGNTPSYKAYSKRADINKLARKSDPTLEDNIGELAVFNQSGLRYIYGLPVYSRNEKNLSYDVEGGIVEQNSKIYFSKSVASAKDLKPKTKLGEERKDAYASSFLLTEITTPEYVDRSLDGPTIDDFGGYTRFNYEKKYGDEQGWYRWRFPYNGLDYSRNSLSDPKDDLASFNGGEKEIYYLHNIETKSHIAIFHTSFREDGLGAEKDELAWQEKKDLTPIDKLQRLDKIELYPISAFQKGTDGRLLRDENGLPKLRTGQNGLAALKGAEDDIHPVKTVHFEYAEESEESEELATGAPNMKVNRGKLTLKRVYFEYNGKSDARISPYVFDYKYPSFQDYPAKYRSGNESIILGDNPEYLPEQNPPYSEFNSDAWGNYQPSGEERHAKMQTWLDQGVVPNEGYDPAAWQLKVIKLPSGGEIHVQYEADDYQYVQDKEAHVMVPLKESVSRSRVLIDIEELGIDPLAPLGSEETARLVSLIQERYINQGHKIYFKFLYRLIGDDPTSIPDLNECNVEYIDGYVDVKSVGFDGVDIFLELDGEELPEDVCKEFARKKKLGVLDISGGCDAASTATAVNGGQARPDQVVRQLFAMAETILGLTEMKRCAQLNPESSYLRVPAPFAKRGGGLRVKRLLTFDKGLEGEAAVYGSEYIYKTTDDLGNEISSGVATNEPGTIREENILVDVLKSTRNRGLKRIVSGKNKREQEGPIGESIYPRGSVGYSKVIIKNIHSGETNPGFVVNEYHTAKEYPIEAYNTQIKDKTEFGYGFGGYVSYFLKKQWASQGFSFVLNDMHGKPKRMATYAGNYTDVFTLNESLIIGEEVYDYHKPGTPVPVKSSLYGATEMATLGKEVDITLAQKAFEEETIDGNVEVDFTVGIFSFLIPIPFATAVPELMWTEGGVATHVSSKVIRYPAILKAKTSYQDGIKHVTEQVAFDKYTGNVIASRSYDEFNGNYMSESVLANWEYPVMGDKASTEGRLIDAAFTLEGDQLKLSVDQVCDLTQFTRGDLIELGDGTQALFHVLEVDYVSESLRVEVSQQNQAPSIQSASNIRIIRTGRMNALTANVGSIVRHDPSALLEPINEGGRYVASTFTGDLNSAMGNIAQADITGDFMLSGSYLNMNMSAYTEEGYSTIDWSNAQIKEVEIKYTKEDDHITVDIMAFEIACSGCSGGWLRIVAAGWT